ncbi:MAG: glycosyltransferase [Roseiarcus sp.]
MSRLLIDLFDTIDIPAPARISQVMVGLAAEQLELRSKRFVDNVLMQCRSAVVTAALTVDKAPRRLLLCLNAASARASENLTNHAAASPPLARQAIASVRLCRSGSSAENFNLGEETFLTWIDDPEADIEEKVWQRFQRWGFRNFPLINDHFYQRRHDRRNRSLRRTLCSLATDAALVAPLIASHPRDSERKDQIAGQQPSHNGKVILFALYWLDFGGAEAFAVHAMKAAKNAGYAVIVVAEEITRHRMLDKLMDAADVVYLIGNFGFDVHRRDLFQRIVRLHRPAILHIHHSGTAYRLLPVFRLLGDIPAIMDTTHILEHRVGGFVYESIKYSDYIDRHHVVSHDLEQVYQAADRRLATKIKLGRLYDMSPHFSPAPGKWAGKSPLKVAFVGRFVAQKRPYLFLEIARRLSRSYEPSEVAFSIVGAGYLSDLLKQMAVDFGISERLTFLPAAYPVSELFGESHVVVNCSENEGLALISYEGIMANCIVLSTDVGGQRELTAQSCLFPREPIACVRRMAKLISRLIMGRLDPAPILDEQNALLAAATRDRCGTDVCLEFYRAPRQ